jgi:hypothetical protein
MIGETVLSIALLAGAAFGETWNAGEVAWFVAGGATGFVLHEGAHAVAAGAFGVHPRLETRGEPVPFLIVRYDLIRVRDASGEVIYLDEEGNPIPHGAQKHFVIASAGINMQNITSEWILTAHPNLREERRPFLKGMLTFNVVTSIGYALVGRKDRDGDIRGMSEALWVRDELIGALIFLPAALDLYRYYRPDAAWAPWASRGAKAYLLGLSFRF